jgi:DNA repair protein RecN (Recombination protein N)
MLTELHIRDLGVIEEARLVLGPGLTALTGETGAGKTMIVEAIELLVGARAESLLVRPGGSEAVVEGRFVTGDDELVLSRLVPRDGRSRAYHDGRLATVATLAEEGARLVDLHGQHAHQSLLAPATQRAALDRYGGIDHAPLVAARLRLRAVDEELATLGGDERTRAREIDLLRFQVAEIDDAELQDADEDAALDAEESILGDALAHREAGEQALGLLAEDGARDALGLATAALAGRTPFAESAARLDAALAELDDIVATLRAETERVEEDPARLADVRQRRQLLRDLRRKYGDTLGDVMTYAAEARHRLDDLERHEERAAALERERSAALADLDTAAAEVARQRWRSAPRLAAAIEERLHALGMPKARFALDVEGEPPADDVQFLLAANVGEPPLPLARVASGGELARAMLAVRLVLSEAPDTLVFDEVDAGVGGAAALAVGQALAELGRRHQVLVVTHLPQVAAFADRQVVVRKYERGGRTFADAEEVTGDARVAELARMLSGMPDSARARDHARELLASALEAHS